MMLSVPRSSCSWSNCAGQVMGDGWPEIPPSIKIAPGQEDAHEPESHVACDQSPGQLRWRCGRLDSRSYTMQRRSAAPLPIDRLRWPAYGNDTVGE